MSQHNTKPDYSNFVQYVRDECKAGRLAELSERATISRCDLYRIAKGMQEVDDEIAMLLATVTEPKDDQWKLDANECDILDIPNLTDGQMIERLQDAERAGKLGLIAHVSGVKGGERTLQDICNKGQNVKLDPLTRSLLLNVME